MRLPGSYVDATIEGLAPRRLLDIWNRLRSAPVFHRLARGAFWSFAGALVSRGLGLLAAIAVGRILGKTEFGELGIIQNTIGVFGTLAGFGMGLTSNKHLAEFKTTDPQRAGRIIALTAVMAWMSSGLLAGTLFLCAPWVAAKIIAAPHLAGLIQAGSVLLLFSGINGAQLGALSGLEAFKSIAKINLLSGLLTFPMMVIGTWKFGLTGAIWSYNCSQCCNCILSYLTIKKRVRQAKISVSYAGCIAEMKMVWAFGLPTLLVALLNTVVTWAGSALVVNQPAGYAEIGIYSAALRMKQIPDMFVVILMAPIIPMLSEFYGKAEHGAYRNTLRYSFILSAVVVIPVSLLQAACPALTLLPFGREFSGQSMVASWLMIQAILNGLGTSLVHALISTGRMWVVWSLGVVFAASYASLCFVLVPTYGVIGFAAAGAIAYGISTALNAFVVCRLYLEAMQSLHWGKMALITLVLSSICMISGAWASPGIAIVIGLTMATLFIVMVFWIFHIPFSIRPWGSSVGLPST